MERTDKSLGGYELQIRELQLAVCNIEGELKSYHDQREERLKDLKEIKNSLQEISLRMARMPDDEHKEHNDFVRAFIEEHKDRRNTRQAILNKIATGGVWAATCVIALLIWIGIKTKLGA